MHELSLCGAIADIATRRAGAREVAVVHVQIGQLRAVVPETLTYCWSLLTSETELDGCALDVERVAAVLQCRACGMRGPLGDTVAIACSVCGAFDVEVTSGDEFVVTHLQLAKA